MSLLRVALAVSCGLWLGACQSDPAPTGSTSPADGAAIEDAAASVPTQEEADAAAAEAINQDNADAEFQRLLREIRNE